jgi:hypothetical protein
MTNSLPSHVTIPASHVTPDANRAKAYRRRRKHGLRRLVILAPKAQLDWLEEHDYLDPNLRGERADEAEAVEAFLKRCIGAQ